MISPLQRVTSLRPWVPSSTLHRRGSGFSASLAHQWAGQCAGLSNSSVPWCPRQEYWNYCHFLLQAVIPTQGSNPCLLHLLLWQAHSSPLNPRGAHSQHTNLDSLAGAPMWMVPAQLSAVIPPLWCDTPDPSPHNPQDSWCQLIMSWNCLDLLL